MQKEITIGFCFLMAGILSACLFGYDYFTTYGFINEYHARSFSETEFDVFLLVLSILWERGKFFVALWLLTYTPIRSIVPLLFRCAICFTMGMFIGACVINIGMFGILIAIGTWIPHGVLYVIAILLIFGRESLQMYGGRKQNLRKIVYVSGTIGCILCGCIAEATAGTKILQSLFRMVRW